MTASDATAVTGPTTGLDHPTTVFLSVHKGASTFLTATFAPAMVRLFKGLRHVPIHQEIHAGKRIDQLALPPRGVVATRVYPPQYDTLIEAPKPAEGRFADKKLVMLRRDPRDVAVSFYYSFAYSHRVPPVNQSFFHERRAALRSMPITDGLARYCVNPAIRQFLWTEDFLRRFPATCLTTYETLVTDFPAWLEQVGGHLGWTAPQAAAIATDVADDVTPPATEDPSMHKRRVTPGNWREVFDEALIETFRTRLGDRLTRAGYAW